MLNKLDLSRALTLSKLKQDIYNFLLSSVTMDNQGMNVYWKRSKNDDFSLVELALQVVREDNNINDYKVVHLSGCKEVLLSLNIGVQKRILFFIKLKRRMLKWSIINIDIELR